MKQLLIIDIDTIIIAVFLVMLFFGMPIYNLTKKIARKLSERKDNVSLHEDLNVISASVINSSIAKVQKEKQKFVKEKYYHNFEIWEVKSEVFLDAEDMAMFSSAKVVSSDFGKSVCFFINSAKHKTHDIKPVFIPLSNQGEQPAVGYTIELDKISIQVIGKEGQKDIMRVKINKLSSTC